VPTDTTDASREGGQCDTPYAEAMRQCEGERERELYGTLMHEIRRSFVGNFARNPETS
jgi:hypothetical protein